MGLTTGSGLLRQPFYGGNPPYKEQPPLGVITNVDYLNYIDFHANRAGQSGAFPYLRENLWILWILWIFQCFELSLLSLSLSLSLLSLPL